MSLQAARPRGSSAAARTATLSTPRRRLRARHFQIELCDGHYYIQDLGSTNGTYLNGKRIDHKERIFSGDVITMGGVDIVFSKDMLF